MLELQENVAICLNFTYVLGTQTEVVFTDIVFIDWAVFPTIYQYLKCNVFDSTAYIAPKMSIKLEESSEKNSTK